MNIIKYFTILAVLGSIFYKCSQIDSYQKYIISNVSSLVIDTLKSPTSDIINRVELKIRGNINGEAILKIENGSGRYKNIMLNGQIDTIYQTEWYEPKIIFKYEPLTKITGDSLFIFYRFK